MIKFVFLVLASLLTAKASIFDVKDVKTTKNQDGNVFWTHQMNILKLYNDLEGDANQREIASNYKLETLFDKTEDKDVVNVFLTKWHNNIMLQKYEIFSVTDKNHRRDARLIVDLFLGIKDLDSFYEFACWAKKHINREMFLYTFTVAVLNRADCTDMMVPSMYEITPNKFFNGETIAVAKNIKMQGRIADTAETMGVKKVDEKTFVIDSWPTCWFFNTNEECKVSYFTEDVDLNNKYFITHALRPFWLDNKKDVTSKTRRGEYFLFMHQQLLNRYYLERLSNDLGNIPMFSYDLPLKTGIAVTLQYGNGVTMPSRPNDFTVKTSDNEWEIKRVMDYERRLRDAVDRGYITLDDGKKLYLNKPEDIELLGNMIESNTDCPSRNFYINGLLIAKKLLGNGVNSTEKVFVRPSIMEQYETALHDPMFWQLWNRVINQVKVFKNNLKPYTKQDVTFDGVTIVGVKTDKLETYFGNCDADISSALYRNEEEFRRNRDKFTFIARQHCLNHRKFDVEIDYKSDKNTEAIVKIFIGPKEIGGKSEKSRLDDKFFQIDNFVVHLKTGTNTIKRESDKFWNGKQTPMSYSTMIKKVEKCMTNDCEIGSNIKYTFPNRLILPKGKPSGMKFQLFVSITPIKRTRTFQHIETSNVNINMYNCILMDDNALGYPLDRQIDWAVFTQCTNMKMVDVNIYHDPRTDVSVKNLVKNVIVPKGFPVHIDKDEFKLDKHKTGINIEKNYYSSQKKHQDLSEYDSEEDYTTYNTKKDEKRFEVGKSFKTHKDSKEFKMKEGNTGFVINKDGLIIDKDFGTGFKVYKDFKGFKTNKDSYEHDDFSNFKITKDNTGLTIDKDTLGHTIHKDYPGFKMDIDPFGKQLDIEKDGIKIKKDKDGFKIDKDIPEKLYRFGNYKTSKDNTGYTVDKDFMGHTIHKDYPGFKMDKDPFGKQLNIEKDGIKTEKDKDGFKIDKETPGWLYRFGNYKTSKDNTGFTADKDYMGHTIHKDYPGFKMDNDPFGKKLDIEKDGIKIEKDKDGVKIDKDIPGFKVYKDFKGFKTNKDSYEHDDFSNFKITKDNTGLTKDKDTLGHTIHKDYPGFKMDIDPFGKQLDIEKDGIKIKKDKDGFKIDKDIPEKLQRFGNYKTSKDNTGFTVDKDFMGHTIHKDYPGFKMDKDPFGKQLDIEKDGIKIEKDKDGFKIDKNVPEQAVHKDISGFRQGKNIKVDNDDKEFTFTKTDKDYEMTKVDKDRDVTVKKTDKDITISTPYFTRTKQFDRFYDKDTDASTN